MSESNPTENPMANATREEIMTAMFANMVVQQTNMAFMFLGRMPHPETGEIVRDLDTAKFFIDQLEMLEVKTKGNLSAQEDKLLKQGLAGLRLAFVEAVEGGGEKAPSPQAVAEEVSPPKTEAAPAAPTPEPAAVPEEESRKKFSKKY